MANSKSEEIVAWLNQYMQNGGIGAGMSKSKVGQVLADNKKKKAEEEKICDFCGPFETCHTKRHTKAFIEDLLIDSGLCISDRQVLDKWWKTKKDDDMHPLPSGTIDQYLLSYSPEVVWPHYSWRVAKYVRSVM